MLGRVLPQRSKPLHHPRPARVPNQAHHHAQVYRACNTHGALSACGNTKPDSKGKPKDSGAQDAKQEKPDDDDDEYEIPLDDKPRPLHQSARKNLMKRLARICTPKEDGTYKVPEEIIQSHKNLETRDTVYRAFEKCGYDPVQPPRLRGALPPKP